MGAFRFTVAEDGRSARRASPSAAWRRRRSGRAAPRRRCAARCCAIARLGARLRGARARTSRRSTTSAPRARYRTETAHALLGKALIEVGGDGDRRRAWSAAAERVGLMDLADIISRSRAARRRPAADRARQRGQARHRRRSLHRRHPRADRNAAHRARLRADRRRPRDQLDLDAVLEAPGVVAVLTAERHSRQQRRQPEGRRRRSGVHARARRCSTARCCSRWSPRPATRPAAPRGSPRSRPRRGCR